MDKKKDLKSINSTFLKLILKHRNQIILLLILALLANISGLIIPRLLGNYIDYYNQTKTIDWSNILLVLGGLSAFALVFTVIQSALSSFVAEKVGTELRQSLSESISKQTNLYVVNQTPSKLLTIFTSDVDAVKNIVSQGIVTAFSAILILFGSTFALIQIKWDLALMVLIIIPLIVLVFSQIFGRIGSQFRLAQQNLEKINRIINESIVAASLIRVLNSQKSEIKKFNHVNQASKDINLGIVKLFSTLIPIITLLSNIATLFILYYGGKLVIQNELSLGQFSAFLSYLSLLITPIFLLSFISTGFTRALISFGRIYEITSAEIQTPNGNLKLDIKGGVEFKNVNLEFDGRKVLNNLNFNIKAGTKTALLGPTAAGKTQIFNILSGLNKASSGEIFIDGHKIQDIDSNSFYNQVGLVFQDSIIFNTTLRENILFKNIEESDPETLEIKLKNAIYTAALDDLISSLPDGLDTIISERGANLSGGQKQRLMLARALALNPKLLLLDDFTARVDISTEKLILERLFETYPGITLISITQKIEPIKGYDQILLVMESELLAHGTHEELINKSLEYRQIWESQQSSEN